MKIISVQTRFEHFELVRPYAISFRATQDSVENAIVEIRTDNGLCGYGAGSPEHFVTGETREDTAAALTEESLSWLIGQDVTELPRLCRELATRYPHAPAARAAVDMALYDLLATSLDTPLADMLGRAHDGLPTSITIGIKSLEETLEEADEYLGRGFKILKVKLGEALDSDIEKLVKLRERIGDKMLIRVDPNQGYSADDVIAFCDRTRQLDIEFLEQPMAQKDVTAMKALPEDIKDLVAADETLLRETDAIELIAPPRACGIFNIKLMKCGGVWSGGRIANIAEASGISLMWGCMDESIISISAALHAALASPATRYLDLDGSLDLARDLVSGGFIIEDGVMRTVDAPGLGVKPLT